ncbi:toxin-antitoxin system HicB family antitoxin [Candidatus Uhrbacteria bacterium]|nr:toxin-antitoxin system HicB family antitoxin [Candidatus Uhrbacteria bacterium]
MKKFTIEYDYIVHHVSDGDSVGYKAVIPAFNGLVFGDDLSALEEGVALAVEEEIKARKSVRGKKRAIPAPDRHQTFSGKFMVRIHPSMHEKLALEAKARGKSLNAHIQDKMFKE